MSLFNKQLLLESQDNPELFNLLLPNPDIFWNNYDEDVLYDFVEDLSILIGYDNHIEYTWKSHRTSIKLASFFSTKYLLKTYKIKNNISKKYYINWLHEIMKTHPLELDFLVFH